HYLFNVPDTAGNRIVWRAKVNNRKFSWWNKQWAFAGVRDPGEPHAAVSPAYDDGRWVFTGDTSGVSGQVKAIPMIPITVMAEAETSLAVAPRGAPVREVEPSLDPAARDRWNDYGIGLLLQGDLKGAEAAFEKVTQIDPKNPDGWVNIGRAAVQEGDMDRARTVLQKAISLNPDLARAHYFYARVLRSDGNYDGAAAELQKVLAQYPRDRVAVNDLGRI